MRGTILRDALQLARRVERRAAGLPDPEHLSSTGLARRHVLGMLGTGAATMAAPALASPPVRSVAIVGGGLAGLNALKVLSERGIDARLYEARSRLGGRVLTLRDERAPGTWEEMGGQLVNSDHADIIRLSHQFGIRLIDRKARGGRELVIRGGQRVSTAQLARELAPIASQIARDSELLDRGGRAAVARLDRMSVAEYLARHRALLASDAVRVLLEQGIRTEFGVEPREASAVELIFNLPTVNGRAFETLGNSDERFVLEGGSGRLVDAMAQAHASRIDTGRQLVALTPTGSQTELRFADGTTVAADRVVLTLPPALLGQIDHGGLFSAPWQAAARELRLGRNEKLNARYDRRVWKQPMGEAGSTWDATREALFAEVWDCSAGQDSHAGILTWFFGGDQTKLYSEAGVRTKLETTVGSALGDLTGVASDQAHLSSWSREPFTQGAYINFSKGQFTRFGSLTWLEAGRKVTRTARSGPIIFAGEHTSDAWPGYMNGAAQTGRLAAETILADR
ncbi:FAD-dependent oxidoreductase [Novosphingobium flavum]|uniref:FAD-dependent oxidoreductase n=1 Tax=Novosphingobium flavum TaxID=1778672 RepID=A0A7X1FNR3_9SPHN|nr:FAD-dependent oxidoreductase [Novosphingobium flavum]MBC2664191.1 FAD-dependent oxidoreductase [Novosphingobium flavum]